MARKITVAVIFGGRSAEHDVSIVTALSSVIRPLELFQKYDIQTVYVAKDGRWFWDGKLKDMALFSSGKIDDFTASNQPAGVVFDGGFTLTKLAGLSKRPIFQKIDVVFPAMHGTFGEDGSLMGLLDMAGVPYVGSGLSASAVAMDKVLSKQLAVANDIPVTKFLAFTRDTIKLDLAQVLFDIHKRLHYPLFIKPAHLGSSIGISKAKNETELANGLEVAMHYDDKIIVEEGVTDLIEVTLPIIGNEILQPGLLERPMTHAEDFFDFETKYMRGGKKGGKIVSSKALGNSGGAHGYSQLPADLPKQLYVRAESLGQRVYKILGCSGIARVDMLIDNKSKNVYFNEVNPLPGSLYAHNFRKAGISSMEMVDQLIGYALERHAQRQELATTFATSFLKQF